MRKIRLSDDDLELFDIEISPSDFTFYQKHKDAFKTMWREQGKPFWTRFVITFRSYTVKHGVIKQMNIDAPKFQNLIDQAFILIHDQFVDGKENMAKNFIEEVAKLAQNQDKFPALDSKSFSKDPFYARDTRELFRKFFGMPDQKASYLKVYILCPVFLRFGGSVCRCLIRWVDAETMADPSDDSYWTPPSPNVPEKKPCPHESSDSVMCSACIDDCGTRYFREKIMGGPEGPKFMSFWPLGDPRFTDKDNPLFAPHMDPNDDWRDCLSVTAFRNFLSYARAMYGSEEDQCKECAELKKGREKVIHVCQKNRKKKKKKDKEKEELIADLKEVRERIDELEGGLCNGNCEEKIKEIIKDKPRVQEALREAEEQELLERLKLDEKKPKKKTHRGKQNKENKPSDVPDTPDPSTMNTVVAGFKVIKKESNDGTSEIIIMGTTTRTEEEEKEYIAGRKAELAKHPLNSHIFTTLLLKEKVDGLPKLFEWWEGQGFLYCVIDYSREERPKVWTEFTLKITGYDEYMIKKSMLKFLFYITKRKKRPCKGWCMEVDDIVACVLPEDSLMGDLVITIQKGFRFESRLTEEEKESLVKHQPTLTFDTILMGTRKGDTERMLVEPGGKEKLKILFKFLAKKAIFGNNYMCHEANRIRREEPERNGEEVIWEQMLEEPDQFEFASLVKKTDEPMLQSLGLQTFCIRYYLLNINPFVVICPVCTGLGRNCLCKNPPEIPKKTIKYFEKLCYEIHEIVGIPCSWEDHFFNKTNAYKNSDRVTIVKVDEVIIKDKDEGAKKTGLVDNKTGKKDVHIRRETGAMAGMKRAAIIELDDSQKCSATMCCHLKEFKARDDVIYCSHLKPKNMEKTEESVPETNENATGGKKSKKKAKNKGQKKEVSTVEIDVTGDNKEDSKADTKDMTEDVAVVGDTKNCSLDEDQEKKTGKKKKKQEKAEAQVKQEEKDESKGKDLASGVDEDKEDVEEDKNPKMEREIPVLPVVVVPDDLLNDQKTNSTKESKKKKKKKRSQSSLSPPAEKEQGHSQTQDKPDESKNPVADDKEENSSLVSEGADGGEMETEAAGKDSLRNCSNCGKQEPTRKTFKKCQKCKEEGVTAVRYYCGRDCQVNDWINRHKMEHKENQLN